MTRLAVSTVQQTEGGHTAGPWQLLAVGDNARLCPADAAGVSLLTIVEEGQTDFAAVYSEADARLIAAAPELLEALRDLCDAWESDGGKFNGNITKSVHAARAAIAKAEGQTP